MRKDKVQNRMASGYLLRDVINKLNGIHFTASDELHTLGALYESMLREMRDAAGDSGETVGWTIVGRPSGTKETQACLWSAVVCVAPPAARPKTRTRGINFNAPSVA